MSDFAPEYSKLSLPLVLAGPILRRAEQKQVCIWVACSKPAQIKAEIYRAWDLENRSLDGQGVKPVGTGISKPVKLGENLYVSVVIATPAGDNSNSRIINNDNSTAKTNSFPAEELLAYDIEILEKTAENPDIPLAGGKRLRDLGLAGGRNSLAYAPFSLPTFFLRARKDSALNILHGSCRKLHGKGHDCLALADEVISALLRDLDHRPSALFLTGDQVYADDVAGPLIRYLTDFGTGLLGWEERIDGISKKLTELKIGERQQIVQQYAKFTSGSADNHLLSFGEFVAMYLVAWNPENWPKAFPSFEDHRDKERVAKYDMEIKQLENARKALPAIRRVLANIPTYMIFDDHEITDDWNITREWHDNVQGSKCGRQIIANGLAAYWAFQAWGNDPELYGKKQMFNVDIQQYLEGNQAADKLQSFQDHFLNIDGWTFACPVTPITVFLDSRTQRSYDSFDGPPRLVNGEGLKSLVDAALNSGYRKGDPLIIVTPTPVFGFDLIEKFQELLAIVSNVYKVDLETWSANRKGFSNLLKSVLYGLAPSHCVFLSGDVHYGFTSEGTFFMQEEKGNSVSMNVTQLNSSALKTTSLGKEVALGAMMGRIRQFFYPRPSVMKPRTRDEDKSEGSEDPVENPERFGLQTLLGRVRDISVAQRISTPSWMAQKSFVNLSGSVIPHLIMADNNIGLVAIDEIKGTISQKLLAKNDNGVQIWKASVPLNNKNRIV